jgi:NAD-dependent dihydropyrimidine dehydrogenase PreA subunit
MAIEHVNPELCTGCGTCINSCPMDVIHPDKVTGKAVIVYPQECMCCASCEIDCPTGAIFVSPGKYDPIMVSWR